MLLIVMQYHLPPTPMLYDFFTIENQKQQNKSAEERSKPAPLSENKQQVTYEDTLHASKCVKFDKEDENVIIKDITNRNDHFKEIVQEKKKKETSTYIEIVFSNNLKHQKEFLGNFSVRS
ncbi:hypothetical protein F4604DRAFT_1677441 [Suillus subluteus]|nr:hypothetical protein F4604DRAFT_1677441 [Suillus subluteus]